MECNFLAVYVAVIGVTLCDALTLQSAYARSTTIPFLRTSVTKDYSETRIAYPSTLENAETNAFTLPKSSTAQDLTEYVYPFISHLAYDDRKDVIDALVLSSESFAAAKMNAPDLRSEYQQTYGAVLCSILGNLQQGRDTVLAAILMEPVRKTGLTLAEVELRFGSETTKLMNNFLEVRVLEDLKISLDAGTTSWSLGEDKTVEHSNHRNLLLARCEDWRVVLLTVASHLARLRTMNLEENPGLGLSVRELCRSAFDVYGPLAERMSIREIQTELESIAFRSLYPGQHGLMMKQLDERSSRHAELLAETKHALETTLNLDEDLQALVKSITVTGRVKEPYSMYRKLMARGLHRQTDGVDSIKDAVALRVVVESIDPASNQENVLASISRIANYLHERGVAVTWPTEFTKEGLEDILCAYVLERAHGQWAYDARRIKDYINYPKENGYRSLHTTAMADLDGRPWPFEVQVRSRKMHNQAEYGLAAHYAYKTGGAKGTKVDNTRIAIDLESLELAEDGTISKHWLLSYLQRTVIQGHVYALAPNGEVLDLLPGTTVASVAQKVHQARTAAQLKSNPSKMPMAHHHVSVGDFMTHLVSTGADHPTPFVNGRPAHRSQVLRTGDLISA